LGNFYQENMIFLFVYEFFSTFSPFSPLPILKAAQLLKSSIALAQFLGA